MRGLRPPTSPNFQIGKAVHAGLQHYDTARWRGGDASPEPVVQAYLRMETGTLPIPLVGVLDLVVEGNVPVDLKTVHSTPDVEGVSREEYYPRPGMACRWCAFRRQCAVWKGVNVA